MQQPEEVTQVVEIERKFDLPEGFSLAAVDLAEVPGVDRVGRVVVHELEALYLDTVDLALWSHRWVLRRRTGGDDAGWHVKRPAGAERAEYRVDFRSAAAATSIRPPASVLREVAVHTRGQRVIPIARVSTTRRIRPLRDHSGTVVAEVMLDEVRATALYPDGSEADSRRWSEVEIEVHGGPEELLGELSQRVAAAGARPSAHASKLDAALGGRTDNVNQVQPRADAAVPAVLLNAMAKHVRRLQDHDPGVRRDDADAVHQMRVAGRRLRSLLATYAPLFDATTVQQLRDELRWLGTQLGAARDAEVIREELLSIADAEPRSLRRGPVTRRIRVELDRQYRQAHAVALSTLDDPRYFSLLDALDDFIVTAPAGVMAWPVDSSKQQEILARLTLGADRRVRKRHARWVELTQAEGSAESDRETALHDVRKAGKRARYAAESMEPVFGEAARTYALGMAALQKVLGDYQDSTVIRNELLLIAEAARRASEDAFTYGRLHALQQTRGAQALAAVGPIWTAAAMSDRRAWLRPGRLRALELGHQPAEEL